MKARSQPVRTVSFVPPAISTGDPDVDKIHAMVKAATERSEGKTSGTKPAPGATKHKKGFSHARRETVGGSIGNLHDGYAANESNDLSSSC
jgi:polyisoprenyl-teichoic acid--peptidoglycan teichoic acid transferase